MTTNAQRGADFERKVRKHLEECGYVVIRSAASKTGVDLVALWSAFHDPGLIQVIRPGFEGLSGVLVVQSKTNGRLDPDEWNSLYRLASTSGATAVLARREWAGRKAVIGLYQLTGPKVPGSRKPPMRRIALAEVPDAAAS